MTMPQDDDPRGTKRSLSPEGDFDHPQGRQRSRAACAPCRQRKRKCDGKMPCGTCVRYEYHCEYATMKRQSPHVNGEGHSSPQESTTASRPAHGTHPSVVQLQAHPLTAPGARFHHRSILDPQKTRFVRANSAIAFARILGMDMDSESIPRLHSFAWHLGLRKEQDDPVVNITTFLTWSDMQRLAAVYFGVIKPEFGLLEEADFMDDVAARFTNPEGYSDIDAIALNVAALGSFFSPNPHPRESDIIHTAKALLTEKRLDLSPNLSIVKAWALRTIYLRLTSRPHAAWLASSITMHQAEACGLHKEMQTIAVVYPTASASEHKLIKTRRKLFWIARALNILFSFEFGRSRITFDVVTTKKPEPEAGGHSHLFVDMLDLLPSDFVDREREPDPPAALSKALAKIEEMETDSHFMTLLKADLAFAIYRRLWLMSLTDAKDRSDTVLTLGASALAAASRLLESRTPWWNTVHAPFQFLCVCLAVGTPKSLGYISNAMALLYRIADQHPTHMVREAYNQAAALVKMGRARKEKELEALRAVPEMTPLADHPSVESNAGMVEAPNLEWAMDLPFEWDIFLNPNLVVSNQQQGVQSGLQQPQPGAPYPPGVGNHPTSLGF